MEIRCKFVLSVLARVCNLHILAFLFYLFLSSCNTNPETAIKIIWIDNKPAAVYLPEQLFKKIPRDSINTHLRVTLVNNPENTPILGDLKIANNIIFEPLIPFSRGSGYRVMFKGKQVGEFTIPGADKNSFPALAGIYPPLDTVPENLLKIYLAFSRPMSEGRSDKYVCLIRNNKDTLKDVFLNLQPELWNEDRTVLTLWLDPGRTKRGLQPNLAMGAPLQKSGIYQIVVSRNWKDAEGISLQKDFVKTITVGPRDSTSPVTGNWKVMAPPKNSLQPLTIMPDEPLDHFLFAESIKLMDGRDKVINGRFETGNHDTICRFFPESEWLAGDYYLEIETRLEDLAGNNLSRPFDRDITKNIQPSNQQCCRIRFKIQ